MPLRHNKTKQKMLKLLLYLTEYIYCLNTINELIYTVYLRSTKILIKLTCMFYLG